MMHRSLPVYTATMDKLIEIIYRELKAVPITLFMVLLLYVDVGALHLQISGISDTLKFDHLDSRLHAAQREEFEIGQHIKDLTTRGLPVDNLLYDRQESLREDEEALKREISSTGKH